MADGLPIDALRAEIESWPIASKAAFVAVLTKLELGPDRVIGGATRTLWTELERELRLRSGRARLDELTPIRDDAWFSATNRASPGIHAGEVPLHRYLSRLAQSVLEARGKSAWLRPALPAEPTPALDVIERWRWLSIYLPPELLLAALAAAGGGDVCAQVELMPPDLGALLQTVPVAQQHLHIGAGPSVARLWDALTSQTQFNKQLDGELPLEHFEAVLLAAGFARRVLAEHVERIARGEASSLDTTLTWFAKDCAAWCGRTAYDWRRDAERLLHILEQPTAAVEPRAWITRARRRLPRERGSLAHRELLRRCFVALAFTTDARLERVFAQYVRVYAVTYRHLVQDPSSCGLDWFTRHFERISPITVKELRQRRLTETLDNDGVGLKLDSLEIRTTPETTWHEVGREVRDYAREVKAWPSTAPAEWGITFHLIKRHEVKVHSKRLQRAGDLGPGGRYGWWYRDAARRVRAIEHLLRRRPETLAVIRGIDIANVELAVPTWIVGPLLVRLRSASREIAREAARRRGLHGLGEVLAIPHLGEDYRRLSEGLRRMDEALVAGVLDRGGRIGHGLALGDEAHRWRDRHRVVYQPLEERLFDLLWELSLVERGCVTPSAARLAQVRADVRRWGAELFAERNVSVELLLDSYRELLDPRGVGRFGYGQPGAALREHSGYPERWLFDRGVFLRGLQPVAVEATTSEADVLNQAQHDLSHRLANASITIECNPSSNFLVGGLASFLEHPILRFPRDATTARGRVSVSLNSDDPISFATRLGDEYAYVYYALVRSGASPDDARDWLDRVRGMGWLSRITRPESRDPAVIAQLVLEPRR